MYDCYGNEYNNRKNQDCNDLLDWFSMISYIYNSFSSVAEPNRAVYLSY